MSDKKQLKLTIPDCLEWCSYGPAVLEGYWYLSMDFALHQAESDFTNETYLHIFREVNAWDQLERYLRSELAEVERLYTAAEKPSPGEDILRGRKVGTKIALNAVARFRRKETE